MEGCALPFWRCVRLQRMVLDVVVELDERFDVACMGGVQGLDMVIVTLIEVGNVWFTSAQKKPLFFLGKLRGSS